MKFALLHAYFHYRMGGTIYRNGGSVPTESRYHRAGQAVQLGPEYSEDYFMTSEYLKTEKTKKIVERGVKRRKSGGVRRLKRCRGAVIEISPIKEWKRKIREEKIKYDELGDLISRIKNYIKVLKDYPSVDEVKIDEVTKFMNDFQRLNYIICSLENF